MPPLFEPGQRFDCTSCGRCCRDVWSIEVDPPSRRRLAGTDLEARLLASGPVLVFQGSSCRAATRDGHCVFLEDSALCSLHAELGAEAKPAGCTQFPFLVVRTPEGPAVAASFSCPAVQANEGRLLAEWAPWLAAHVPLAGSPRVGFRPVEAGRGHQMDWPSCRELEREIREILEAPEPARPLFRRAAAFCRWLVGGTAQPRGGDRTLLALQPYLLAALVGTLEAGSPAGAPGLTRDFLGADRVRFEHFGWEGHPARLLSRVEEPGPEVLEAELRRYLGSLVFRKFLFLERPVATNLLLLALLPWLLRMYAWAAAEGRGASSPEREDAWRALEVVEHRLVTHATGLDPLFESLTGAVLRQLEVCRAPAPRPRRAPWAAAAGFLLLLGLGSLVAPSRLASVALVVEEQVGHGHDVVLRRALRDHGGHATWMLALPEVRDRQLAGDVARAGDEVGIRMPSAMGEGDLDALRQGLRRDVQVGLDTVEPGSEEQANLLGERGFRVVRAPAVSLEQAEKAVHLAARVRPGQVLVVEGGPNVEVLVRELDRRGLRVSTLSELASHPGPRPH